MSALEDLLAYIFDGARPSLYAEFAGWVRDSGRFREFATHYRSKIRAKLRNAQNEESLQDVRAELETAALLLGERRFTLEYERYAALKQRGPDYTVPFKTHTPFNVEVRRIRSLEVADQDSEARMNKLIAVLGEKARQMPPSIPNLLWLIAGPELSEPELDGAVQVLRQKMERKENSFFQQRGFASTATFHKQFRRLSGIILHQPAGNVPWLNTLARHETPQEIVLALQRLDGN